MIDYEMIDNPYLLLTPGPLSTSKGVRSAMLQDWCTWDDDYNVGIVQNIRRFLVETATENNDQYTAVLMQGSGSFGVEACLGTAGSFGWNGVDYYKRVIWAENDPNGRTLKNTVHQSGF